ncbi:protein of unknown function (plasmid) [Methylocella tundrae]|uniref:Uncharacterized protein n=1 Tax=Methylocella tundrae TaxID=227605 RepID=A0A4U8Z7R9_METTU|nr:protein of unknown function [Methylocella tundrae]
MRTRPPAQAAPPRGETPEPRQELLSRFPLPVPDARRGFVEDTAQLHHHDPPRRRCLRDGLHHGQHDPGKSRAANSFHPPAEKRLNVPLQFKREAASGYVAHQRLAREQKHGKQPMRGHGRVHRNHHLHTLRLVFENDRPSTLFEKARQYAADEINVEIALHASLRRFHEGTAGRSGPTNRRRSILRAVGMVSPAQLITEKKIMPLMAM